MSRALISRVLAVPSLSQSQRAQMLSLMHRAYEGVRVERFERDLSRKQYVILIERREDSELVGFSTVLLAREQVGRGSCEVLYSGDTVLHPDYWGHLELQNAFARFAFRRVLRNPTRRVYWLLLSAGYKTYLLMVHYLPKSLPRRDRAPSPEELNLRDGIALRWFGAQYNPVDQIVRFSDPHYRVRRDLAPIDSRAARDPDIAFFATQNPGHHRGDELVCLARVRAVDLIRAIARIAWRRIGRSLARLGRGVPLPEAVQRR